MAQGPFRGDGGEASADYGGSAQSDHPELTQFLVRQGIDSISLNPDTVLKTTLTLLQQDAGSENLTGDVSAIH